MAKAIWRSAMSLETVSTCGPPAGSRFVGPEGARVRYLETGHGAPVLLIHGATSTADEMAAALFGAFAPNRWVISVDRPGHGWSDRRRWAQCTAQAQAQAVVRVIEDLELRRPVVVGHSYGGAVAMALALARPELIKGVVAVSPIVLPEPRLEHALFSPRSLPGAGDILAKTAGRVLDVGLMPLLWDAMFKPQAMPDGFKAAFPFARARSSMQMIATGEDASAMPVALAQNLAGLTRCTLPVRVLVGSGDIVARNLHGRTLAAAVPDGAIERLDGLGHMLHWFAPERIAEAVRDVEASSDAAAQGDRRLAYA